MLQSIFNLGDTNKEQDILISGKEYKLWRKGTYLGVATYVEDDENIGDSFQREVNGITQVYTADEWRLFL